MKRNLIWTILLSAALTALAYVVELVIAIMVLAVGGIIIYKLLGLYNQVLGPNSPQTTNSVVTEFWYDRQGAAINTTSPGTPAFSLQSAGGVPLQYGVSSSNGLPWVCVGTNIIGYPNTNQTACGVVYSIENDSNYMEMIIDVGGSLTHEVDDINANAVTNWPLSVYILSSTNLTQWSCILTDESCVLNSVNSFTDTIAPSGSNFYRIYYQ